MVSSVVVPVSTAAGMVVDRQNRKRKMTEEETNDGSNAKRQKTVDTSEDMQQERVFSVEKENEIQRQNALFRNKEPENHANNEKNPVPMAVEMIGEEEIPLSINSDLSSSDSHSLSLVPHSNNNPLRVNPDMMDAINNAQHPAIKTQLFSRILSKLPSFAMPFSFGGSKPSTSNNQLLRLTEGNAIEGTNGLKKTPLTLETGAIVPVKEENTEMDQAQHDEDGPIANRTRLQRKRMSTTN